VAGPGQLLRRVRALRGGAIRHGRMSVEARRA
jgi:hypothetical protein